MCGIVAYLGQEAASPILLRGLEKLEYRGYDSAGIFVGEAAGKGHLIKRSGPLKNLRQALPEALPGQVGLGHTRWATHGEPSEANAHPHVSADGRLVLVHNGVVDNYQALRAQYLPDLQLKSSTDTEVLVNLIAHFKAAGETTQEALRLALNEVQGSYALALLDIAKPDELWVAKRRSPLLIGLGEDFKTVVSDALATDDLTIDYIELEDNDMAQLTRETCQIWSASREVVSRPLLQVKPSGLAVDLAQYDSYMAKEIAEEPAVIKRLCEKYLGQESYHFQADLLNTMQASDRLYFVACGTSWHASLLAARYLEAALDIPAEVHLASEFSYYPPRLSARPFFIFLSQSGETADTLQVQGKIASLKAPSLAVTNAQNSSLARQATFVLPLYAGPEIAVASTKAYVAQVFLFQVLAACLKKNPVPVFREQAASLIAGMETILQEAERFQQLARRYFTGQEAAFYIGRGLDQFTSYEAALKLKEISYLYAEGFAAGELKHGSIALIQAGLPVIAILTEGKTSEVLRSNIEEVKTRGAHVLTIASQALAQENDTIILPPVAAGFEPLLSILPTQYLAYEVAKLRGLNVDKPRNLAKSVTVE